MVQPDYWRLPAPVPAFPLREAPPASFFGNGFPQQQQPQQQPSIGQMAHGQMPPMMAAAPAASAQQEDLGGVSAVLDYDMQDMAYFLASQVQAILNVGAMQRDFGCPPALTKFALQLLHATRLPLSTLLAGLVYLENRPRYLHHLTDSSYYAMTLMLVISNKFMDDHTFTNRSWSEVTGFDLALLNQLERDWLVGIRFSLTIESNGGYGRYERGLSFWQAFARQHSASACACQACIAAWFPLPLPQLQAQPAPSMTLMRKDPYAMPMMPAMPSMAPMPYALRA